SLVPVTRTRLALVVGGSGRDDHHGSAGLRCSNPLEHRLERRLHLAAPARRHKLLKREGT
ncbi:MAG: hypothetical protein SGPRY_015043, partial [Prymnesium sp.]